MEREGEGEKGEEVGEGEKDMRVTINTVVQYCSTCICNR